MPVQNGLYAAAAGAILYAVFGTSRQISTGPSSGLAAVAASAVVAAKIVGTQDVASFVATITLASGVLFLLLAVFRWAGSRSSSRGPSSPASSSAQPSTWSSGSSPS